MKKQSYLVFAVILPLLILLPGCDFIGDVFKAGIWVGVIIIIAILAVAGLIFRIFSK